MTLAHLPQAVEELLLKTEVEDVADRARLAASPSFVRNAIHSCLSADELMGGRPRGSSASNIAP